MEVDGFYYSKRYQKLQLIEDYRFALLNKLHNVLVQYLNENKDLDIHWIKWFGLIKKHCYN